MRGIECPTTTLGDFMKDGGGMLNYSILFFELYVLFK